MSTNICLALVVAVGQVQGSSTARKVDTVGAERAAAQYAAQHLYYAISRTRLAFDSLPRDGHRRSHEQSMVLAQILAAEATDRASVITCTDGPSSCRMGAFTGLIGLHLRSIDDSTAEFAVSMQYPSGLERVPIATYEPTLRFARRHGKWKFDRSGRVRIT